jgi:adenylate cyclase class IV
VKQRIAYRHKGVHFDIDIYPDIPPLLEIEAEDKKTIYKWIKKLGMKKKTLATF